MLFVFASLKICNSTFHNKFTFMSVINEHQSKLDIQNNKERISKIDVLKNALCLSTQLSL
jgi:hypothetical protein